VDRPVALISGVGRSAGIGAAIAKKLANDGWDLALTFWPAYDKRMPWGVQPLDVDRIKNGLKSAGARTLSIEADLEKPESAEEIFNVAKRELGPISALVLSHCEGVDSGIMDTAIESFDRHFALNARASCQLIKELANQIPGGGGRIVALTSEATVGNLPYGASKGALGRIVIAAARELSHLNITANVVNPGPIDTGWMNDKTRKRLIERQPSGRLGTPQDVANLIAFLLSPAGYWINGQLIKSDGGFSASIGQSILISYFGDKPQRMHSPSHANCLSRLDPRGKMSRESRKPSHRSRPSLEQFPLPGEQSRSP
jgi:3-oxoacyl-[acyl-carrier protein] reductase